MRSSRTTPYDFQSEQTSLRHSPCSCGDLDQPFSIPNLLELATLDVDQIQGSREHLQVLALIAAAQEKTSLSKRLEALSLLQDDLSPEGKVDCRLVSSKVLENCLRRDWESQACELVPYLQGPLRLALLHRAADKGWVQFLSALAQDKVGVQSNSVLSHIHVITSRFRRTHKGYRLPGLFGSRFVQTTDLLRVAVQAGQRKMVE